MYSYYGFTDQIFQTMYILNTSLQREKVVGGMRFKMVKVSFKRMYGLKKLKIKNTEVIVSDRERTLIDLIYFPQPVRGLKQAFRILEEQIKYKNIDIKKLVRYAVKFPSVSTRKRIGFVLDKAQVGDNILKPLLRSIAKTSLVTLFPSSSRKGRINKKWMVIENAS
jgi:predicted transcriptional regulator of viral defense system